MSAGKRKPSELDNDGLLDLGDVSQDLAVLEASEALLVDVDPGSATDYDYDSVSSPGGSTCSGPTYIRHTGFGPDAGAGRPLSQLSEDGIVSPGQQRGPPSPTAQPDLLLVKPGVQLSRHQLGPGSPLLPQQQASKSKTKKKKGLLRPDLQSELSQEIRGVKVWPASKTGPKQLGTTSRYKHKKGQKHLQFEIS